MSAYYNEVDPFAANWLRNLIAAGLIAPGDVDGRSIEDVRPIDLLGYTQCHFFAGIGVWSHALRSAGWRDDEPVWTGSCPCQPFSAAGKRGGTADERHLWPHWFHLIGTAKPRVVPVFGEQVASKDGLAWLDLVHADLEGAGYTVGAVDLCAAGLGAPHIRQRLFFVAHAGSQPARRGLQRSVEGTGAVGERSSDQPERPGDPRQLAESAVRGCEPREGHARVRDAPSSERQADVRGSRGATNGYWRDADWLPCIDGKARPVEPGTFPLVDGSAFKLGSGQPLEGKSRVGMLRGYGNAIVAPVAAEFIRAYRAS